MDDLGLVIVCSVFTTLLTLIIISTCKWYMHQISLMITRNNMRNPVHYEIRQREKI